MGKIKIGHYTVETTHENTLLFPKAGLTKGDLISYYTKIAPIMLPYIKNRPISMQRFPNGIHKENFYQKDAPNYFPPWIARKKLTKLDGGYVDYILVNNKATLAYLANQACIVVHIWLSKVDKIDFPDRMIFDLDPSDNNFAEIQKAALLFKEFLESIGLQPFAMTTGSRGIHVVVPIARQHPFDWVRSCAHDIGSVVVNRYPTMFTMEIHKEKRGKKIFIDTLRNAFGQTGVAPYSVRAKEYAPIATPLFWHEVSDPHLKPDLYTIKNIFKRLETVGDPWESINKHASSLTSAQKIVKELL